MAGDHPLSFERLYGIAPAAARIEPNVPYSPYDMSVWPIRQLTRKLAQIRYQFHTRNLEVLPFVRVISRKAPALTFRLLIFCLDDGEMASQRVCSGRVRTWILRGKRQAVHWELARKEFALNGDDVYEDSDARSAAEEGMLEEALDPWDASAARSRQHVRSWSNRPVSRDLATERETLMAEMSASMAVRS